MRFLNYLLERIHDTGDTGKRGKSFEELFKRALDLLDLQYTPNTSSGALWDIRSLGENWKRIVDDTEINIKLSSTKWMFGSSKLYTMLPWDEELPEDFNKEKYEKKIKRFLNSINLPDVIFLKPVDKDIESKIIEAAKNEDIDELDKLFIKKNFRAEKLGKSYKVRLLTRDGRISSIAIDKSGKVFMRSEKPRKMGGSIMVAFRSPSPKIGSKNRSVKKD